MLRSASADSNMKVERGSESEDESIASTEQCRLAGHMHDATETREARPDFMIVLSLS